VTTSMLAVSRARTKRKGGARGARRKSSPSLSQVPVSLGADQGCHMGVTSANRGMAHPSAKTSGPPGSVIYKYR
jgi:hypothetical protein